MADLVAQTLQREVRDNKNGFRSLEVKEFFNKDPIVITHSLDGTEPATTTNYGVFFNAPFKMELMKVVISHQTAGTDGSAVTLQLERLQGTEALDAGDTLLAATYNLKGTINSPASQTLTATKANRVLNENDRLALKDAGTPAVVAGLVVTIVLRPLGQGHYRFV